MEDFIEQSTKLHLFTYYTLVTATRKEKNKHCNRVCYLARARAMARLVLAQIEFARAICGSRKILLML